MQLKYGEVTGVQTPVGIIPAREELNLEGLDEQALADLDTVLTIDTARWQQEMGSARRTSSSSTAPEEIWRRTAASPRPRRIGPMSSSMFAGLPRS